MVFLDIVKEVFGNLLSFGDISLIIFYVLGIVFYAMITFNFYRFLGARDLFKLDLGQYSDFETTSTRNFFKVIFYVLEFVFILPIIVFFWFFIVSVILLLLSETKDVSSILVASMALVASIRITSYYNEDLSKDLAKLMPLVLLGVFLPDVSSFSISSSFSFLVDFKIFWSQIVSYLGLVIIIEVGLRIIYGITRLFSTNKSVLVNAPKKK